MRAVLFDLDDTLVDQENAVGAAVVAWAAAVGVSDAGVAARWTGISARHYARYQRRDALFAGYLERYEAGWAVFGDAAPALRRARAAGLTLTKDVLGARSAGLSAALLDRSGAYRSADVRRIRSLDELTF